MYSTSRLNFSSASSMSPTCLNMSRLVRLWCAENRHRLPQTMAIHVTYQRAA